MAKYKCPVCGAAHKEKPEKCRLCGQSMVSASAVPDNIGGVKQVAEKRKGLASVMLIALGGVVVIGLVAVILGLVPSNKVTDGIRDVIPGLKDESKDGWRPIEATNGSFTAEMPGDATYRRVPFNAAGAQMEVAAVKLGSETELSIASGTITRQGDETDKDLLERLAGAWAQDSGFEVSSQKETSFAGYPARLVDQNQGKFLGKTAEQRTLLVLADDVLYVIQSTSVYPDQPQFDRLASTVVFIPTAINAQSPPTDGS